MVVYHLIIATVKKKNTIDGIILRIGIDIFH